MACLASTKELEAVSTPFPTERDRASSSRTNASACYPRRRLKMLRMGQETNLTSTQCCRTSRAPWSKTKRRRGKPKSNLSPSTTTSFNASGHKFTRSMPIRKKWNSTKWSGTTNPETESSAAKPTSPKKITITTPHLINLSTTLSLTPIQLFALPWP